MLALQHSIFPHPEIAPFVLFTAGVALTSWLGGRGPGFVATALSAVLGNYHFIAPFGGFSLSLPALLATGLFAVAGSAISLLSGSLRTSVAETAEQARRLQVALSEQARDQESLRASEERLRFARTASRLGIYDHDMRTETIEWDERMRELWGIGPTTPITWELITSGVHPDDRPIFLATADKARKDGSFLLEYRVIGLRDGVERWVRVTGHVSFVDGQPVRQVGTAEDITERKRSEDLARIRLSLYEFATTHSLGDLLRKTLDEAERLTGSLVGFYHFIEPDQRTLSLQVWSTRTANEYCVAEGAGRHYSVDEAGVWADCVHQRRPVIHNDYAALQDKRGLPEGHAPLIRELVVPIFREGLIVAILGIGNKPTNYNDDDLGLVTDLANAAWEIAKRKRSEEELRRREGRLRAVLDATPFPIAVVDLHDDKIEFWSRSALAAFGHTAATAPEWYEIAYPDPDYRRDVVARWKPFLEVARESKKPVNAGEYRVTCSDGSVRICELYVAFLPDNLIVTFNDVTKRRQAEDALRLADQRKDEFLAVLSHELRNPLAPIRNSLYILQRTPPGSEQTHRAEAVIDRQVSHLARLVDDLLDVTRISRGKIRLQRTRLDLVEVVRRTVDDHRSILEGHAVDIDLPLEPVWIYGDPTRLAQILGNLLTNAAKFTPADGKISVSLRQAQSRAALEVADAGIGIDPDTLRRLFEPFAQADRSLDRSRGGLGLGLALVKGLVELHHGEVRAHSEGPGTGARFSLSFPLDEQMAAGPTVSVSPVETGHGSRVLVIEDNRDAADSLVEALSLSGHRVTAAYDGETGFARAREFRPEVVLCDIGLPAGMDGYAVARALRREPTTASAYLVALTGYAQPDDKRRALEAGFHAHMAKPPDLVALERLLARASAPGIEQAAPP